MITDLAAEDRATHFDHASPGRATSREPFSQQMRRHIGQAAYIMPGAGALIRDEAGHVLLQRRGDTGEWGLPAGAMEIGERLDQTIIREVREETGLEVKPTRLVGIYSDQDFCFTYPSGDQVKAVSTLFECHIIGGQLQADGVESLKVEFFSPDALPPMIPRHARRVRDALINREEAIF
jgi:8-oxo-dGTP pyrophosphatase MutT (NUDIX family)